MCIHLAHHSPQSVCYFLFAFSVERALVHTRHNLTISTIFSPANLHTLTPHHRALRIAYQQYLMSFAFFAWYRRHHHRRAVEPLDAVSFRWISLVRRFPFGGGLSTTQPATGNVREWFWCWWCFCCRTRFRTIHTQQFSPLTNEPRMLDGC